MNGVYRLLSDLRCNGVSLWVEDGQLRYRAPKGALTPAQLFDLRECKADIISFLDQAEQVEIEAPVPALKAVKRPDVLPLSYAQERLWLLEEIAGVGSAYNLL